MYSEEQIREVCKKLFKIPHLDIAIIGYLRKLVPTPATSAKERAEKKYPVQMTFYAGYEKDANEEKRAAYITGAQDEAASRGEGENQGMRWVNIGNKPPDKTLQYHARAFIESLGEWSPDVIFFSTEDSKWKRCVDGSEVKDPENYQILLEQSTPPIGISKDEVLKVIAERMEELSRYVTSTIADSGKTGIKLGECRRLKKRIASLPAQGAESVKNVAVEACMKYAKDNDRIYNNGVSNYYSFNEHQFRDFIKWINQHLQ